jgi:hypothetical protein
VLARVETWVGQTVRRLSAPSYDVAEHERLRLWVFCAIALTKIVYFLGGTWDIQWHISVGRDSLFVPPHLVAGAGFLMGSGMALLMLAYEFRLQRTGAPVRHSVALLGVRAPLGLWVILLGYASAAVAIALDDAWHRAFGLDARLWSPPHLFLMASTAAVDVGVLLGLVKAARNLGLPFSLRSGWCWAFVLAGANLFDATHFANGEAFLVSYQSPGPGIVGLLFPLILGALLPLPMLLLVGLARRFWVLAPSILLVIAMQYVGTGFAELGFAILRPASQIEEFLRTTPNTTIGVTRDFARRNGFELVGLQQAWTMWLSLLPLLLVALLGLVPWARRHPLVAAPVYGIALLLVCAVVFPRTPALEGNNTSPLAYLVAALLIVPAGLALGGLGLRLARLVPSPEA